jgi:putative transport protein
MSWYEQLVTGTSVAGVIAGLALAATSGLALGGIKLKGFSLGVAGILFAGLAVSQLLWSHGVLARLAGSGELATLEQRRREMLELVRELGLVLFVYSIGIQVGSGFLSSLRAQGLRWNLLALSLVAMNVLGVVAIHRWLNVDAAGAVGLMSGAVTNTPALAAVQQALRDAPGLAPAQRGLAEVGYAVAYPFGVVGTILSLMLVRVVFRLDPRKEAERFRRATRSGQPLGNLDARVANPAIVGQRVGDLAGLLGAPVVVSRMMHQGSVALASADTQLDAGDLVHAVGQERDLQRLAVLLGGRSDLDVRQASQELDVRKLVVTRSQVVGQTLGDLGLRARYGVNVTRIRRAGIELVPDDSVALHYGDTLVTVGDNQRLADVEALVGNAVGELELSHLVPIFLGIATGVLLGSIPISLFGLPAPVRLGLAGGPLLVALAASHFGRVGRFNLHLPNSANLMLRDLGIVLFLGSVGLLSGERFVDTLVRGPGLQWLLLGAAVTLIPLIATELLARFVFKMDYTALCGVVAGSMTSPSVLSFANQVAGDGASIAYGAVYPLVMILRVVTAQVLIVLWIGGAPP